MAPVSFYSMCCVLLAVSATARHIHRPRVHQHQRRHAAVTLTATSDPGLPPVKAAAAVSMTAGDDAIEDIQQIQQGLTDLPANLLSFVQAAEAQLEDMERMLQEFVASSTTAVPDATSQSSSLTALAASTTSQGHSISTSSIATATSSASGVSTSSSSLIIIITTSTASNNSSPTSGSSSDFLTTFQTSSFTSTKVRTLTVSAAVPSSVPPSASSYLPSGSFLASGNWTLPYAATSGRTAVAPSVARTTAFVPPAPTAWEP